MLKRVLATLCAALLYISQAHAQSSPGLINGQVPTAAQWNSYFAAKQDVLGYTPVNRAGDTMTGKFRTFASSGSQSGFAILAGTAPSTPSTGDVWMTTAGMFYRTSALTIGPLTGSSGGTPLTNHGVVLGTGTAALNATAAMTAGQLLVGQGATADPLPKTLSQDCTLTLGGVVTCLKTNNVAFTSAATTAIGTSGATIPLLNGNNTFSGTVTVSSNTTLTNLTTSGTMNFNSTDSGASGGPNLNLNRTSASPAASDLLGYFAFNGSDSAAGTVLYADMFGRIVDPVDGTEDGALYFRVQAAGAGVSNRLVLDNAGATVGGTLTATSGGSLTGTWSNLGSVTTVDINGGTIDGVTIATSSIGASQLTGTVAQARLGATGTWTPADNSGAGLSFTSVDGKYTRVGDMVFAYASFEYPATASGANASFSGLPVTVPTGANRQCSITYTTAVNATYVLPVTGGSTAAGFYTSAGVAVTNAQMASTTVFIMCIYSSV